METYALDVLKPQYCTDIIQTPIIYFHYGRKLRVSPTNITFPVAFLCDIKKYDDPASFFLRRVYDNNVDIVQFEDFKVSAGDAYFKRAVISDINRNLLQELLSSHKCEIFCNKQFVFSRISIDNTRLHSCMSFSIHALLEMKRNY